MDEPNANLDAEGEAALGSGCCANAQASRGATVIVVAHRPSALAAIDTLLMLKDGKQVAFGPKDEVLAKVLHNGPANDGKTACWRLPMQEPSTCQNSHGASQRSAEPDRQQPSQLYLIRERSHERCHT